MVSDNFQEQIREALGLSNCIEVIVSPDRTNIFYAKYLRKGNDSIECILKPIALKLFGIEI
jgi:superfamily II DNA helicase RecQ